MALTYRIPKRLLLLSVRHMASRIDCAEDKSPRCSPENDAKEDCDREKLKRLLRLPTFNIECCNNPCIEAMPRFDDIYYKPSDKAKRIYNRTWHECPLERIAPKKCCCLEKKSPPFVKRAPPKRITLGASCKISKDAKRLMPCRPPIARVCPRLVLAGCKPVRNPPKCVVIRPPSDCQKICTPYPSYSECIRDDPKPLHPTECRCLIVKPYCPEGTILVPRPK